MNTEAIYAALPEKIGTDADLDETLRRLCRIPPFDGAHLSAVRGLVLHARLVTRDRDGVLVKTPDWRQLTENEMLAARAAEEERRFRETHPPERYVNKPLEELTAGIEIVVGARLSALEQQVAALVERLGSSA